MASLIHQRCFNHALREAVARCPECGHFYCRECTTEHEDRIICAGCLAKIARRPLMERSGFIYMLRSVEVFFGIAVACLFFWVIGRALLSIDSSVHEGTIWKEQLSGSE
jgi:hypothetical protein